MKKVILILVMTLAVLLGVFFIVEKIKRDEIVTPLSKKVKEITEKPLEKYTFARLREAEITPSSIQIGKKLKDDPDFASYMFYYTVDGALLNAKQGKRVSGLINIPKEEGTYPVIVLYRGFVPRENFTTGEGTRRTAEEFARNGFITLAPDFLGYGESDGGAEGSIEDRFQTYPTALTMLASVQNLPAALQKFEASQTEEEEERIEGIEADTEKVGIWGHSNGGHISLSVLAITGKDVPTVLWNPVTKPFPYSILFFTDDFDDEGKALRKVVAEFEEEYDVFAYSPSRYYKWISAPIQLHQGTDDEAVPVRWSDQFVDSMEALEKEVEYFKYPGENHNFNLGAWPTAVARSIDFYTSQFEEKEE